MVLAVLLRLLVVLDFFANEKWYVFFWRHRPQIWGLRIITKLARFIGTLDIAYEHFDLLHLWILGIYACDIHPPSTIPLSPSQALSTQGVVFIVLVWTIGWVLTLSADLHKDITRESQGQCMIWGSKAKYIECSYTLACGKVQSSKLLYSGK